jgi:hypothetical protein
MLEAHGDMKPVQHDGRSGQHGSRQVITSILVYPRSPLGSPCTPSSGNLDAVWTVSLVLVGTISLTFSLGGVL